MKQKRKQIINLLIALTIFITSFSISPTTLFAAPPNTSKPETMEVHFINVGQGDSTLIKCGEHSMLIDTGDDTKGTLIQNYLKKQNTKSLDYLVLTHPDSDHIGGAPVIITKFDINKVFVSNFEKENKTYQKLIQALDYKRLKYETPKVGTQYSLGTATITILAPNKEYDNPNDSSIALIVQNGNNKFLFSGDAGEVAEQDIIENNSDISADVYKVGHHGSKYSTSSNFFKAISPTYAVISCGENNSYGHPHAETLNTLRINGVKVYRTDEDGTIIATSDGNNITFNVPASESWKSGEPVGSVTNTQPTTEAKVQSQGSSAKQSQETVVEEPEIKEPEPPVVSEPSANGVTYVLNKNTKKFHIPSCSSVDTIKPKNREDTTKLREEIINSGYVPCKRCNP